MIKDRLDLFLELIAELHRYDLKWVAENSDVSLGTLYRWLDPNGTLNPRIDTMFKVGKTLNFDLSWKMGKSNCNHLRAVG